MFCSNCGREIENGAKTCIHCGYKTGEPPAKEESSEEKSNLILVKILSAFIPIAGLIIYLIYIKSRPLWAKSAGEGAVIGLIIGVALSVVSFIIGMAGTIGIIGGTVGSLTILH